ncbi:MAG: hypothetical protein LIP77_08780 [Planctomycetes bacterium]|nr:hypothetical protein [Planctomycetota bacterium]
MRIKLLTGDTLKCAACGNKEFVQKQMSMGSDPCWCAVCERCTHMMSFMRQNQEEEK